MVQIYRSAPAITVSKSSAASLREIGLARADRDHRKSARARGRGRVRVVRGRIGYVGRLTPSKRVDHIVRALGCSPPGGRMPSCGSSGGGAERTLASLRRSGEALGMRGSRFVSPATYPAAERDAMLASLDCLVMASAREGWGRVVSEAARYGVPSGRLRRVRLARRDRRRRNRFARPRTASRSACESRSNACSKTHRCATASEPPPPNICAASATVCSNSASAGISRGLHRSEPASARVLVPAADAVERR